MEKERDYESKVIYVSKEVSAKERIMLKDVSDCESLDSLTDDDQAIMLNPDYYAQIEIHNEKSDNKDYTVTVVVDKDGTRYKTGSESFVRTMVGMLSDAKELEASGEPWSLKVYKKPSKNRSGKGFITCSIV